MKKLKSTKRKRKKCQFQATNQLNESAFNRINFKEILKIQTEKKKNNFDSKLIDIAGTL